MTPHDFFDITEPSLEERLQTNVEWLKSLSAQEYGLYKKWDYLQHRHNLVNKSEIVKAGIWTLDDVGISDIRPRIQLVDETTYDVWKTLKIFLARFPPTTGPGNRLNFIIDDETTGKYLGVATLASGMLSLGPRDNYIGWTKEDKSVRLECSPNAQMVIPTQPFGFNCLGGKLIASLLTSQEVRDWWLEQTGRSLVGITAISLYGAASQYNSIPKWKTLGETNGLVTVIPDDRLYKECHAWVKVHRPEEYERVTSTNTGVKQKILKLIMDSMSVKDYKQGHRRGVHYTCLYENTREYLRRETDVLIPYPQRDMIEWWRMKALKRFDKLTTDGRLNPDTVYYNDLIGLSWSETQRKHLTKP